MEQENSRLLRPKQNPSLIERHLPSWLLHDLMQPLNAYGLVSEQLKETMRPLLAEQPALEASWAVMDNAIRTQERNLNKLRQFMQLHSESTVPDRRASELAAIAERLQANHQAAFPNIDLQISGFDSCAVVSNPERLYDVLSSLIENAATHTRSDVRVSARRVDAEVRIEVRDSGEGIPDDLLELLGMPFLRAAGGRRGLHRGMGLGLYAVAKNCELLGHELRVHSEAGAGTVISITLAAATGPVSSVNLSDFDPLLKARLMLVDGHEKRAAALVKLLESWQCHFVCYAAWSDFQQAQPASEAHDLLLIGEEVWLASQEAICAEGHLSLDPASAIFILAGDALPTLPVTLSEPAQQRFHLLCRPLTPTRLRAELSSALQTVRHVRDGMALSR